MQDPWCINIEWEHLGAAPSPEEAACFGALSIYANGHCLTEGNDALVNRLRKAPYLSGYHMAQWLAWNWWRLRWEPRSVAPDWGLSHRMASIGEGYVWPDITLVCDGERMASVARSTPERAGTPFRYITDLTPMVPATAFEVGVDSFLAQVLERLDAESLHDTDLHRLWHEVQAERADEATAFQRKLEALLGSDPDEPEPAILGQLLQQAQAWGAVAAEEIAAGLAVIEGAAQAPGAAVLDISSTAGALGAASAEQDRVRLVNAATTTLRGQLPAWRMGVELAQVLRAQEGLAADRPVADEVLAQWMGTRSAVVSPASAGEKPVFAFVLDESDRIGRIALRSRWHAGRRFELARLLSEQLAPRGPSRLRAATLSKTYQQKMQRAFAAELLCPYAAVREMLQGDHSEDARTEVAQHFQVSELTVRTQLVNNGTAGSGLAFWDDEELGWAA